jgi:hypothetical protein
MSILLKIKRHRKNKNIIRHQILEDIVLYSLANKLDPRTYYSISEIAELHGNEKSRFSAIKYLLAKGELKNKEEGIVENISISPDGLKSYYSEHYQETGERQIATFWKNTINIILSIVVAAAAIIALRNNDNYKDELKTIPQIRQELNNVVNRLDSIKKSLSPIHIILDSPLNKK